MNFYPIFGRELGRAARRRLLYWLRTATVVTAVFVGIFLLNGSGTRSSTALGRDIFNRVTGVAFFLCLLSGVILSSNLLCEEKREGSLTLLFLTRLKGLDVIMGKVGAIGLLAAQIVFALIPVLAVCMVLGGVSGGEFARMIEALIGTLGFSLAMGIFVSALNRSMGRAALLSFFAISATTVGLALADAWAHRYFPAGSTGILIPGPVQLFLGVADVEFRLPPGNFRGALLYQWALSAALLLLGGSMLKRLSISDEGAMTRTTSRVDWVAGWRARRHALRRNPTHWMILRQRRRWLGAWFIFGLLVLAWIGLLLFFSERSWSHPLGFFLIGPLVHFLLKVVIMSEAAEFFAPAKRGELEMLLVSPLSVEKIVSGHARALIRQFLWPAATIFAVDLYLVFFYKPAFGTYESADGYLFIFALGITLLVDLPALVWRGLWNGLRSRNALSALRCTFFEVLGIPLPFFICVAAVPTWFAAVFLVPMFDLFHVGGLRDNAAESIGLIVLWWVTSFIANAFLQRDARHNLELWLRYIAANGGTGARLMRRRSPMFPPNALGRLGTTSASFAGRS